MTIQRRNDVLANALSADLQPRYEMSFAWTTNPYLQLTGLRGLWPMSSIGATGSVIDVSGQTRTLTEYGDPVYGYDQLAPYVAFNGVRDYLARADEGALDILGTETYLHYPGLTMGCWVRFSGVAAATETVMSKWLPTGNQRSYKLDRTAAGLGAFSISADGTTVGATVSSTTVMVASTWYFLAGRFIPSTSVDVWVNDEKSTNAVSVPSAIFNSTADFRISGDGGTSDLLAGDVSWAFLCAGALSDAHLFALYHKTRALYGQ